VMSKLTCFYLLHAWRDAYGPHRSEGSHPTTLLSQFRVVHHSKLGHPCRRWVRLGHSAMLAQCPVRPKAETAGSRTRPPPRRTSTIQLARADEAIKARQ